MCMLILSTCIFIISFFNDTATTEIYTLSLHDALPIFGQRSWVWRGHIQETKQPEKQDEKQYERHKYPPYPQTRSEEHTSELQSLTNLVCRLLLEKKK